MNHLEIVKRYAARQINTRTKTVCWCGESVYCEGDVIYSYGRHFPLAKYLGTGIKNESLFIKNNDKYSSSTSHHQGIVNRYCYGPSVSRLALAEAGLFEDIKLNNIVCFRDQFTKLIYKDIDTGRYYENTHGSITYREREANPGGRFFVGALEKLLVEDEWKPPTVGEFVPHRKRDKNRIVSGVWSIIGASVISLQKKYYLCFANHVIKLPKKPGTMQEAFVFHYLSALQPGHKVV